MQQVLIAYRTEDGRHTADRIRGALEVAVDGVECIDAFADGIGPDDLAEVMREVDAMVVVVDPEWADAGDGALSLGGCQEVLSGALRAALVEGVRVVAVLQEGARMPAVDALPEQLKAFASLAPHELGEGRWADEIADLFDDAAQAAPAAQQALPATNTRQLLIAAGLVGVLVLLGGLLVVSRLWFAEPPAIVGRWAATVDYGRGEVFAERFEFRQTGGSISGSATWQGNRRVIEAAVQDGDRISFHTRGHENFGSERRELRHEYVGIVGDTVRFTLRTNGGFTERPTVEFEAERVN